MGSAGVRHSLFPLLKVEPHQRPGVGLNPAVCLEVSDAGSNRQTTAHKGGVGCFHGYWVLTGYDRQHPVWGIDQVDVPESVTTLYLRVAPLVGINVVSLVRYVTPPSKSHPA